MVRLFQPPNAQYAPIEHHVQVGRLAFARRFAAQAALQGRGVVAARLEPDQAGLAVGEHRLEAKRIRIQHRPITALADQLAEGVVLIRRDEVAIGRVRQADDVAAIIVKAEYTLRFGVTPSSPKLVIDNL